MSPFSGKNVTFRTYAQHADLIDRAAEKAGKTVSAYCRDLMVPLAAKDLGVPVPELPDMERGRHSEVLERAAALTGLTPEQFARQAIDRMAAAALGYAPAPDLAPPSPARLSPHGSRVAAPGARKRRAG